MRYSIKLSYIGAGFCGWQIQPDAPSVQQTLEEAISTLTGVKVSVTGAGRTDTGVNAIGYVAHFELPAAVDTEQLRYKLNAILPKAVAVHEIAVAADDFHARFDASNREYTYFLHTVKDPFIENWSYRYSYPGLDFEAMNEAASLLLGTHDFHCFEKTGGANKTSICTVRRAGWLSYTPTHVREMGFPAVEGQYRMFKIAADRFLRNMVRATVGTLLEVGRGRRSPASVAALLAGGTRSDSGESVPGFALFLSEVDY